MHEYHGESSAHTCSANLCYLQDVANYTGGSYGRVYGGGSIMMILAAPFFALNRSSL